MVRAEAQDEPDQATAVPSTRSAALQSADSAGLSAEGGLPYSATVRMCGRIASPEMLPSVGLLPHVICSPPVFGGGGHEADQHGDTGRVDSGGGGAVCPVHSKGSGAHSGRVWGVDGPASQACDASASRRDAR